MKRDAMPSTDATGACTVTDLGSASALPRIAPAMAQAFARLYSGSGPLRFTLREGGHRLRFRALPRRERQLEWFRFAVGPHAGLLAVDRLAVARTLQEREADQLPRELRCVLWADALHELTQALERLTRLRFEWGLPADAQEVSVRESRHEVGFECELPGGERCEGLLQFDDAAGFEWLQPLLPPAPRMPRPGLDRLRIPLPFCLGSTQLALRELADIRPGDLLAIERWRAAGQGIEVAAELRGAARRLVAHAEGAHITLQQIKDLSMNTDTPVADDNAALPLDRLDALEVTLRFEVGELGLTLGQVKSLQPGHVFELEQPLTRALVRILAHGNVLGKGHLVAVGERLGVRVTEFAPGEI